MLGNAGESSLAILLGVEEEEMTTSYSVLVNNKGDAVAFYNYRDVGSAQLDWAALHCGSPTDETKWIANYWYWLNDCRMTD
jgi:hypothetical protein